MKAVYLTTTLLLIAFLGYEHHEKVVDQAKMLVHNPAELVLNANLPAEEEMYSFDSEVYGEMYLYAGTEPKYGLRHILARHTSKYFVNYDDKNGATLFEDEVSGGDLILGIKDFYKHCVDVDAYNRKIGSYKAYVGYATLANKKVKCLLIVKESNKSIITFYPFKKLKEAEIQKEIWEEIESEREEKRKRDRYIYD